METLHKVEESLGGGVRGKLKNGIKIHESYRSSKNQGEKVLVGEEE